MKSIQSQAYSVFFLEKGYQELIKIAKSYSSIFILVDENTIKYCYPKFKKLFLSTQSVEIIQIKSGEEFKHINTCIDVWNKMTQLGADRYSLLITLGGGVITDLGGFVASTFKRGIDFINIPTTLLSMVDASVGGKTGVDLGVLKNQIGVFSNPKMVLIDTSYLTTLEEREIRSGTAEIIKYGLTYDQFLYDKIRTNKKLNIIDLIHRSIQIKNEIVLQDPKESGMRKILNFGHTIGHAIESYFLENKNKLTHGEAIAIGMVCESFISNKLLGFSAKKVIEIKETIIAKYGKTIINDNDFLSILELLKHDKKNISGNINFVLLKDIENCKIDCKVDTALIIESLRFYNI